MSPIDELPDYEDNRGWSYGEMITILNKSVNGHNSKDDIGLRVLDDKDPLLTAKDLAALRRYDQFAQMAPQIAEHLNINHQYYPGYQFYSTNKNDYYLTDDTFGMGSRLVLPSDFQQKLTKQIKKLSDEIKKINDKPTTTNRIKYYQAKNISGTKDYNIIPHYEKNWSPNDYATVHKDKQRIKRLQTKRHSYDKLKYARLALVDTNTGHYKYGKVTKADVLKGLKKARDHFVKGEEESFTTAGYINGEGMYYAKNN